VAGDAAWVPAWTGTPTMWSLNAVLEHRRGPRLFKAILAGLGALAAAALSFMISGGGLAPPSARAEAETPTLAGAPAQPSIRRLYFLHGPGGEILNLAP
jgi:hypothetical protein